MKNTNKGAVSTGAAVAIVVVIIILLGLAYWWYSANPAMNDNGQNATTTTQGTDNGTGTGDNSQTSTVTTNPTGDKTFTNFRYNYSVVFPADAKNNISSPENVSFAFANATGTADATLKIGTSLDVTHVAYCLTIPTGATGAASTTINGTNFLTYNAPATGSSNNSVVYYRVLHKSAAGTTCYDIQKASQGSATLNTKLNNILGTFTFHS